MERRLAAILAYDVVGYSLAMGRDEAGIQLDHTSSIQTVQIERLR